MDPALHELIESGSDEDEVSAIIRLKDGAEPPPGVRVVARFGEPAKIVTVRYTRGETLDIYRRDEVESMKAARRVVVEELDDDDQTSAESDVGLQSAQAPGLAQPASLPEDGSGVLVGLIDYGFDFTHENLRKPDGTTRCLVLWDQSADSGQAPPPYGYGRVYTREEINQALATEDPPAALGYHPSKGDPRGNGAHGTHVADILAGNRKLPGSQAGLASGSDIIFVHLAAQRMSELANFGDSVRLLEALDFVRNQAGSNRLAINLSAGKTGGGHNGTELFAQAVDAMLLERPGLALAQSVGNYAASRMHTHARLGPDQQHGLHWLISPRDRTPNELEVWYSGQDRFGLTLIAPTGERFQAELGENVKLIKDGIRWGTLYHRQGEPNSGMNHIDIFLRTASPPGQYRVELYGDDVVDGRFHAWIERDAGGHHQSHFPPRQATSSYTTNTICNSFRGIAVGAYDATTPDRPATRFSSRGPTADERLKPELAAPGYRIRAARSLPADGWHGEPRLTVKSGTSMAAPHVTGTIALMMQAAPRPLSITEIRRLLIGTADPAPSQPGRSSIRFGYGYLNTPAAVEAARRLGRQGVVEQEELIAHEALVDAPDAWAPRWVVDAQPFEDEVEVANKMAQTEGAGEVTPLTVVDRPSTEDEAANSIERYFEDRVDSSIDEAEIEGEEQADVYVESQSRLIDDLDPTSAGEEDEERIVDEMTRQEDEEETANRLTELYESFEELAEKETEDERV